MGTNLPRWDLSACYKSVLSDEFAADIVKCENLLKTVIDSAKKENADSRAKFLAAVKPYEEARDIFETLNAYVYAVRSVDAQDKDAVAANARVEKLRVALSSADVVFNNIADEELMSACDKDSELKPYSLAVKEAFDNKKRQLSEESERLAAELLNSGAYAWDRLQQSIFALGSASFRGEKKTIVQLRTYVADPDRETRRDAQETEISIWKEHEADMAAALNGVKGQSLTMYHAHGFEDPIETSVRASRITRKTLDSLISSLEKSLPVFRRYFRAKAKALGVKKLAFYDLFAPVSSDSKRWEYSDAKDFILTEIGRFNPAQAAFTKHAFENSWIDAEPRAGKIGGAYDTFLPKIKESRVLANFDYSFDGVLTLAHELGHAWHDSLVKNESSLRRTYPMTLAETASTFNETVVTRGAIEDAANRGDHSGELALLEQFIQGAAQVCVDILCRFYFERELFRRRETGEVVASDLCSLMLDCQKKTYGDALDETTFHPYMWALKTHYYSIDFPFYNYPYAFGLLFGLGIFAHQKDWGAGFLSNYSKVLENSGSMDVKEVTSLVGLDLEKEEFWQQGIDMVASYVARYEALVEGK